MEFLNKFNIISNCQYGIRNKISTADAIDLRKAFDTLHHDILLKSYIQDIWDKKYLFIPYK